MKYNIGVKYTACLEEYFIEADDIFAALWLGYVKYKSIFDLFEMDIKKDCHSFIVVWDPRDISTHLEGRLIDLHNKAQKILEASK